MAVNSNPGLTLSAINLVKATKDSCRTNKRWPGWFITSAENRNYTNNSCDAVSVQNLYVSYRKVGCVIAGLCMKVPRGSIYGLLGPSGCGKTTLLQCIAGCMQPNSGEIKTFGVKPGSGEDIPGPGIGYMPQETALYIDLTIEETLSYFGTLYFMDKHSIATQMDQLIEILDLPEKTRLVGNLSGGQIRRVSFATALIHKPRLAILDEPTAGADPILSHRIWEHLRKISTEERITVIVTTHYIEEATNSNVVGLMRKGRILAEESPAILMLRHNSSRLEDVFLKLCTGANVTATSSYNNHYESNNNNNVTKGNQEEGEQRIVRKKEGQEYAIDLPQPADISTFCASRTLSSSPSSSTLTASSSYDSDYSRKGNLFTEKSPLERWFIKFLALLWKNFHRNLRHPLGIAFQYILPISQIILICICVGADPFGIPMGFVDEDTTGNFSSIFLKSLNSETVQIKFYEDTTSAINDVRNGKLWGLIHVPSTFSRALVDRFSPDRIPEIMNVERTVEEGTIRIYGDLTHKLISITVERSMEQSFLEFMKLALIDSDLNPALARLPIELGDLIYGKNPGTSRTGYREYMAPGFLVSIMFCLSYGFTALLMLLERNDKMFDRHQVIGVTPGQILLAHFTNRLLFCSIQVGLIMYITLFVFEIPVMGSPLTACLVLYLISVTGMAFGLIISSLCHEINTVTMLCGGTMFVIIFVSGVYWPLEAMPSWFRWFSYIQPTTYPINSLRHVLAHGFSLTNPEILYGMGWSLAWFVVLFSLGAKLFRYK